MSRRGGWSDADLRIRLEVAHVSVADAHLIVDGRPYQRRYRWESAELPVDGHADVRALAHGCLREQWDGSWPPTGSRPWTKPLYRGSWGS